MQICTDFDVGDIDMKIRHLVSSFSAVLMLACTAYTSETTVLYGAPLHDPNGKPCGSQGGKDGDGGIDNSDPIDLSTGGFIHRQTDLVIPGRGLDFEIKRIYSSYGGVQSSVEGGWDPLLTDPDTNTIGNRNLIHAMTEGPMGDNWDYNYNMRISFSAPSFVPDEGPGPHPGNPDPVLDPDEYIPGSMDVMTGSGRIVPFFVYSATAGDIATTTPVHFSNDHFRWRLSYTKADEPVYITDSSLTVYEFFGGWDSFHGINGSSSSAAQFGGRLKSITDRNGNKIEFIWETSSSGQDRIDYAIDTLNNQINFVYHNEIYNSQASPNSNFDITVLERLIWKIVDHADREYEYLYTRDLSFPVLSSVTSPAIVSNGDFPLPTDHERFSSGRTWSYAYDNSPDLGGWWSGRMLTTVTSPNGAIVTKNEYDYLKNGSYQNFDRNDSRVKRQQYGNAFYNYIVTDLNGSIDLPRLGVVDYDYYVWVNDRRGAITRFKYAGRDSASGFHRQLLEKVEFPELDPDPDHQVWGVESGGVVSWRVHDTSTSSEVDSIAYLSLATVNIQQEAFVRSWDTNTNWDVTLVGQPNGDSRSQDPWRASGGIFPGQITEDPLLWGAVESSTVTSQDLSESITEEWRYDFIHSGGVGGCGCGSNSFATAHKDGNGYVTIKDFDFANGNLLKVYHDLPDSVDIDSLPLDPENHAAAVETFDYNVHGQVISHTHPHKKRLTVGGGEINDQRIDQFEYYNSGHQNYGRLYKSHVDVGGFNLVTVYEYDSVGNISRVTDPGGDISEYIYNQSSELVQEQHFDSSGIDLFAQTDYYYDANGNVVREEVLNLDKARNPVAGNSSITTINEYDLHDYLIGMSRESGVFDADISLVGGPSGDGTGRYELPAINDLFDSQKWFYDVAKNLIQFRDGEAVNGAEAGTGPGQSENIVRYKYDARDLMINEEAAFAFGDQIPLDTTYEYDSNERLIRTIVDATGQTQQQSAEYAYDAFNRLVSKIDPMGNEYLFKYDENHNAIELRVCGPVDTDDDQGSQAQATLAKITREYGPLDLMVEESIFVFDYVYDGINSVGPSCEPGIINAPLQTTLYEYNDDSSLRRVLSPSGQQGVLNETLIYYDSASRLETRVDGAGNVTEYDYDLDSNLTRVWQLDVSSNGITVEEFEMEYEYDELNRQDAVIDGVGNRTEMKFDSRSNVVEVVDARNHVKELEYDSLNRLIRTTTKMDPNGTPYDITESKSYDASSRLISETDDNGNTTEYVYDGVNRLSKITMPDGAFYTSTYDFNGNVETFTDARGVIVTQTFDRNNRLATRMMSGTVVPGATSESYSYDGLSRLRSSNNESAKITREYDSRSNIIREIQNYDPAGVFPASSNKVVAYEYDDASNTSKITYPSGRVIDRTFDQYNRMTGIFNDTASNGATDSVTQFEYIGRRLASRINGNGTRTDYSYNGIEDGNSGVTNIAGDFGFGRVASISTTNVATANVIDGFVFAWDESQNRINYTDVGSGMINRRDRSFEYDSANRLISTDIDYPDSLTDHISPFNNGITSYALDGVHNRTDVSGYENNGAPIGGYSQNGSQAQNNQYSITPRMEGGEWANVYDANGNLTEKFQLSIADFNGDHSVNYFDISAFLTAYSAEEPSADVNGDGYWNFSDVSMFTQANTALNGVELEQWYYTYDFRNQLVESRQVFGTMVTQIFTNAYDTAARRIIESIDLDGDTFDDSSARYVFGGTSLWEVLEQIDIATEQVIVTHVYGLGIDDEVSYEYLHQGVLKNIWSHRDDLNSLTSVSDEAGDIVERYEYGDYGKVFYFDDDGLSLPDTQYNAQHLYTGRSLITGTGLYDYRFRVLEPDSGRFNQRDPLGYINGLNIYSYVGNNPGNYIDPFGLKFIDPNTGFADSEYNGHGGGSTEVATDGTYSGRYRTVQKDCEGNRIFPPMVKVVKCGGKLYTGIQARGKCCVNGKLVPAPKKVVSGSWGVAGTVGAGVVYPGFVEGGVGLGINSAGQITLNMQVAWMHGVGGYLGVGTGPSFGAGPPVIDNGGLDFGTTASAGAGLGYAYTGTTTFYPSGSVSAAGGKVGLGSGVYIAGPMRGPTTNTLAVTIQIGGKSCY